MNLIAEKMNTLVQEIVAQQGLIRPIIALSKPSQRSNTSWDSVSVSQIFSSNFKGIVLIFYDTTSIIDPGAHDFFRELTNIIAGSLLQVIDLSSKPGGQMTIPCQTFAGLLPLLQSTDRFDNIQQKEFEVKGSRFRVSVHWLGEIPKAENILNEIIARIRKNVNIERL